MSKFSVILFCFLFLFGCSVPVMRSNPKPNIDLRESSEILSFSLGTQVEDSFVFSDSARNGLKLEPMKNWHAILKSGFKNGFSDYFQIKEGKAKYSIKLLRADLEFPQETVHTYRALIRFKARLLKNDKVIVRASGNAFSKSSTGNPHRLGEITKSAVETMYENIAKRFF